LLRCIELRRPEERNKTSGPSGTVKLRSVGDPVRFHPK
jgi:hypothetical protein